MSAYFDLVINCDIREDVPPSRIKLISWLCDINSNPESWPQFGQGNQIQEGHARVWDYPFLAQQLEEETFSNFQSRYRYTLPDSMGGKEVRKYSLHFFGRNISDDTFFDCHLSFLIWVAPICENGFIGYYKEESRNDPVLMYVNDGKLITTPKDQFTFLA